MATGAMTSAQFDALPPHLKLRQSHLLVNEMLLNHEPLSAERAQSLGLGHLSPLRALHVLHGDELSQLPILAKRPLNSFMAFRSYYGRIFATLQQKDTSTLLKILWDEDPFKAKWCIVAKAYSKIRDEVGRVNARLDVFLNLVCPEIGIINVEDYLAMMNWDIQVDGDGAISLHQTATPLTFEHRIMHTNMSDTDVVLFAGRQGYIQLWMAIKIAGSTPQPHGLLATVPAFQLPALPRVAPPAPGEFLQTAVDDPASAASMILGFDVNAFMMGPAPYEWTGSMSDLYNPNAGSIDLQGVIDNPGNKEWDVSNISDPQGFDSLFEDAVQGGYTTPFVPDDEGPSYM